MVLECGCPKIIGTCRNFCVLLAYIFEMVVSWSHELCLVVHTTLKSQLGITWYFDSDCSSHMTGEKSHFYALEKCSGRMVTFRDDSISKVVGKGYIQPLDIKQ